MVERAPGELPHLLNGAIAAQITSIDGLDEQTFLHDKIRETLYAQLSADRRAALHLSAARSLADGPAELPDQYGQIAHHFRNGGDPNRAIDYLEKAATHALALAANADADRFLREALELEAKLPVRLPSLRRARWLRQRGDALGGLGMMAESADALRTAAALLGRPFPGGKLGFALGLGWQIMIQFRHRLLPRRSRPPRPEADEILAETGRVFDRMHEAAFYLGRDADLVLSTMVCLNTAERAGPPESRAIAYSNAAMMAGVLPARSLAERYFRLAHAALGTASEMVAQAWLLEMEGHYRVWQGEMKEALPCLDQVIMLASQGGFARRHDEAECVALGVDIYGGRYELALARAHEVERRARKRRDSQVQCWAVLQRAECQMIRGKLQQALSEIAAANALLPAVGRPERIWAMGLEAHVRSERGERAPALELLRGGLDLAFQGPPVHSYCLGAYDRMAETALKLYLGSSDRKEAQSIISLAKRACAFFAKAGQVFPIVRPAAALHRGTLDLLLRPRRAGAVIDAWQAASLDARRMGLPLAELRLDVAILGQTNLSSALRGEVYQRVHELAGQLGIQPDLLPLATSGQALGAAIQIEREVEQANRP
jgi:tetratricopeptide (TPR) repeat protein